MAMRCEEVQELILSDYMDGELGDERRRDVEAHLGDCEACREFKAAAFARAGATLKEAPRADAPSYIWERVKQKIAAQAAERSNIRMSAADLMGKMLSSLARVPKPALAFAAAAVVIIAVILAIPSNGNRGLNDYLGEQVNFMAKLDADDTNGASAFDTSVKTGLDAIL